GYEFLDRQGNVIARMPSEQADSFVSPARYAQCRLFPANAHLEATFEFLDAEGRVLAVLRGWQDRYFSLPHSFYRCRLWPQQEFLSEAGLQAETGRICRRIDADSALYVEQSWGLWKSILACLMLSRNERDYWHRLPAKGPRRAEWLLGRIAAKDAVRQWAAERHRR